MKYKNWHTHCYPLCITTQAEFATMTQRPLTRLDIAIRLSLAASAGLALLAAGGTLSAPAAPVVTHAPSHIGA